jgi:GH15 family glucan-1,4-alpha-glucosidase
VSAALDTIAAAYRYPGIGDYAAIGDGRTVALISHAASVDWLCLPNFDGPGVFSALLDRRKGGYFKLAPRASSRATRQYLGDSNVLETRFDTATGSVLVTDCLTVPDNRDRIRPRAELLRVARCLSGEVEMEMVCEPRGDFAQARDRFEDRGDLGWAYSFGGDVLFLQCEGCRAQAYERSLHCRFMLAAEEERCVSLAYTHRDVGIVPPLGEPARQRVRQTRAWWQGWADDCQLQGEYRDAVVRSALVLKLLHFELSGAVVAAATTSLPEVIGGVRNWDYRYCWLRDASLTFRAFIDLGYRQEANFFLDWLLHTTRVNWPRLRVFYDVFGDPAQKETELDQFEGYRGSKPVRTGNAAEKQLQLDAYGAVIQAAYEFVEHGGTLDFAKARCIAGFGRTVCRLWREPDEGIWEARGARKHHTYSKIMCWVALDRLLKLASEGHVRIPEQRFRHEREAIAQAVEQQGFSRRLGSYVATFGGETPDASLLLAARSGFRRADDPRMRGTYELIERELGVDGMLYRYPPGSDGLPGNEGTFGIASFWAVEYLALAGRIDEARARFEALLTKSNDVGLFAEEIDPETGEALGNFPQAFTHVGLITAANALQRATMQHRNPRDPVPPQRA